jgi:hypothetical protein
MLKSKDGVTGACLAGCNNGYYDIGNKLCSLCSKNCRTCTGTRTNCTSCNDESTVPVLMGDRCISSCASTHTAVIGVCEQCRSPCASCESSVDFCTSCDGIDGRIYKYGTDCLTSCPEGTSINYENNHCNGCRQGCKRCNSRNPMKCEECQYGYFNFDEECVTACPSGYVLTFD